MTGRVFPGRAAGGDGWQNYWRGEVPERGEPERRGGGERSFGARGGERERGAKDNPTGGKGGEPETGGGGSNIKRRGRALGGENPPEIGPL